jgi:hypothetical protein
MAEGEGDQTPSLGVEVPFNVGISDSEIDFSNSDERERWLQTAGRVGERPVSDQTTS